jgi:hypothetical protein
VNIREVRIFLLLQDIYWQCSIEALLREVLDGYLISALLSVTFSLSRKGPEVEIVCAGDIS